MPYPVNRRQFLQGSAACAAVAVAGGESYGGLPPSGGKLVLNDDGHVFLNLNDDLGKADKADLRRHLQSYCRPGLDTVAYCVGDMSWPTLYPSRLGVPYSMLGAGGDFRRLRIYKNVDSFAAEPGGYFGTVFRILRELGKKVLASFRVNDAHFTSLDNPNVSEFWKQHAKLALGAAARLVRGAGAEQLCRTGMMAWDFNPTTTVVWAGPGSESARGGFSARPSRRA